VVRTNDSIRTAKDLVGKKISAGLINSVKLYERLTVQAISPDEFGDFFNGFVGSGDYKNL
jgi:hypothetical protein